MIYTICWSLFLIGAIGFAAQLVLGGLHIGHAGHGGMHHGGHAGHHAPGDHSHGSGHHGSDSRPSGASWLLNLLSPLTVFSFCLGMGAAGVILSHWRLAPATVAVAAVLAGWVFCGLIIRPLWKVLFKFASKPSTALDGAVAQQAEAASAFDASGRGLIRLNVDGQTVRILARLEPDDVTHAAEIALGDRLTVTAVDGRTNTCRVARL